MYGFLVHDVGVEKKLTNEEERERQKKADKRRAKKKKRKEKKRAEKELKLKNGIQKLEDIDDQDKNSKDDSESSAGSEEEDLDPTSAFVAVAASKNKKISSSSLNKNKAVKKDRIKDSNNIIKKDEDEEENMDEISPVVLQSRQLAIRGNEMANVGQYAAAICLFSEAIKLDPRDFRFFGNRSYCFDRLSQFDKALRDAETAISLCTTWPKGYFRKGRALSGLKLYSEAEQAFEQVLKLDKNCDDAVQELLKVRTFQLTDMGFQRHQAESSIRQFGTVQSALDSLLAGVVAESSIPDETYLSDGEEYNSDDEDFRLHIPKPQISADDKMNPRNPEGLTSLWVGNVAPEVTEKMLVTMFTKFGTVTSVRLLSEKHCSFVNFKEKLSAGKAMESLQGKDCFGEKLLVRFPDNPIVNGQTTTILKKTKPVQTKVQQQQQQQQQQIQLQQQMNLQQQSNIQQQQQKQSGPVNGDECYFWRTTGCIYGDKCRFKHIKEHKGIDKKPWQKPSV
ncbi:Tetratricopeptide repeat protein 31 [Nymphon striatum]|nr:Tetratricopeptide repeat protein 31 [Nymphon striatum]